MAPLTDEETKDIEKKLYKLELRQEHQEEKFSELRSEMCEAKEIAEGAMAMSLKTQAAVEGVPGKVMEALRQEKRANRFEFRDWVQLLVAVIVVSEVIQRLLS